MKRRNLQFYLSFISRFFTLLNIGRLPEKKSVLDQCPPSLGWHSANKPSIDTFQMLRMVKKRLVLWADRKGLVCGDGNKAHLAHTVFQ